MNVQERKPWSALQFCLMIVSSTVLVFLLIGLFATIKGMQPDTSDPTVAPTSAPTWVTTQNFTGNGNSQSQTFAVGQTWQIAWTCDPTSDALGQYNVIVNVYNADGTLADVAINTICQDGNTSGVTTEHQGGNVYVQIMSEGTWTVGVVELQ